MSDFYGFFASIPNFMSDEDIVRELKRAREMQKKLEEKCPLSDELLMVDHRIKHLREEAVKRGLRA